MQAMSRRAAWWAGKALLTMAALGPLTLVPVHGEAPQVKTQVPRLLPACAG